MPIRWTINLSITHTPAMWVEYGMKFLSWRGCIKAASPSGIVTFQLQQSPCLHLGTTAKSVTSMSKIPTRHWFAMAATTDIIELLWHRHEHRHYIYIYFLKIYIYIVMYILHIKMYISICIHNARSYRKWISSAGGIRIVRFPSSQSPRQLNTCPALP